MTAGEYWNQGSRTTAPWTIGHRIIASGTIAPQDNYPPRIIAPRQLPPSKKWPPGIWRFDNCPTDNYPRKITLQIIALS